MQTAPKFLLSPAISDLRCCQRIDQLEGLVTSSPSSLDDSSRTTVCSLWRLSAHGYLSRAWLPPMHDGLLPRLAMEPKSRVHWQAPSFPTCQVPFSLHHAAARSWLYAIIIKRHGLAPAAKKEVSMRDLLLLGNLHLHAAMKGSQGGHRRGW